MFRAPQPSLLVSSLCALALLVSGTSDAEVFRWRKGKGSAADCNMSFLPFIEGATWKYQYAIPPGSSETTNALRAKVPETFSIRVKSIESHGDDAKITLEESYRTVVRTTILTCHKKYGLFVPIDSFYFSGELPGAIGVSIEDLSLKGEMYPGSAGFKEGDSFYVGGKATIVRTPAGDSNVEHPKFKLEIERQITIGSKEDVETEHGIHAAYKVEVTLSKRLALKPTPDKSVPLPEGNATLWFAKGLGLIRSYNRMGQGWELVEYTNAAGDPIRP